MAVDRDAGLRTVIVLAPMPLEMQAITAAFGLEPSGERATDPWTGRVGNSAVTAVHTGMGPPLTRRAMAPLFDPATPGFRPVDHVMIAGICGGLDPDLEVGTLLNPEVVVEHRSGASYRHDPPGDAPRRGKLVTTEEATLDHGLSRRFFEEGYLGVDMESSAVAEVCEAQGCEWSVYRCIGDRWFDGLLDEKVLALSNPDGSGNLDALRQLLAAEPEIAAKLQRLSEDTTLAARRAAEAAVRGCRALDA
jgi:nucleoside phosphorylase